MPLPTALRTLADLAVGASGLVADIALDVREADWLRAVGLFEGTRVTVLRRAPLGGPLHVRTTSGAEFAVDRQLARAVAVSAAADTGTAANAAASHDARSLPGSS